MLGEQRMSRRLVTLVGGCLRWLFYWTAVALVGGTLLSMVVMEAYGLPSKQLLASSLLVNLVGPDMAAVLLVVGIGVLGADLTPDTATAPEQRVPETACTAPGEETVTADTEGEREARTLVGGDPGVAHAGTRITCRSDNRPSRADTTEEATSGAPETASVSDTDSTGSDTQRAPVGIFT
jgi:hypothetical protein